MNSHEYMKFKIHGKMVTGDFFAKIYVTINQNNIYIEYHHFSREICTCIYR